MGYTPQLTAAQWIQFLGIYCNDVVAVSENGRVLNEKFNNMTYGLTDQQILALPQFAAANWTETDLNNVKYALSSLNEVWNCINNVAVGQANRMGYFEPFLLP